ncbi:MAG: S24 family peptidase [Candidatus Cryptobacteroides sp.]
MDRYLINKRTIQAINYLLDTNPKLTKTALADSFGISASKFTEILKERMNAGTEIMSELTRTYGISADWLLSGDGEMIKNSTLVSPEKTFSLRTDRNLTIQEIPLYDFDASAGLVAIFNDMNAEPVDYLKIPNLPAVDGAIYVRGESMSPLLKSGDIVMYKKKDLTIDNIFWGEIYLLSFNTDGDSYTAVKYIRKSDKPGMVCLASFNPQFAPKEIPMESITALALVKASLTFHTME